MSMIGFPLLLIPLAIYNIIVFLMPGLAFSETLVRVPLVSGEIWAVSLGDILLALGVLLLLLEVIKASRPGGKYLTDHLLSLIVFGGAAAEFVMWPKFASSTFFLLALLAMVEFFSGVALRTKRRRGAVGAAIAPAPAVEAPAAAVSEPAPVLNPVPAVIISEPTPVAAPVGVTPAPAPASAQAAAVPAAASVAESVLLDHPDPRLIQPATVAGERSQKVVAPELQPEQVLAGAPMESEDVSRDNKPEAPKP